MDTEKGSFPITGQDPVETVKTALEHMATVQKEYIQLVVIVADVIEIVRGNQDDEAEIGRRVKRLIEDYANE